MTWELEKSERVCFLFLFLGFLFFFFLKYLLAFWNDHEYIKNLYSVWKHWKLNSYVAWIIVDNVNSLLVAKLLPQTVSCKNEELVSRVKFVY